MGNISRSFYNDLRSARKSQAQTAKPIMVQKLTKAGVPSKMQDDTKYFDTLQQAEEYMERVRSLNPNRTFNFRITERKVEA